MDKIKKNRISIDINKKIDAYLIHTYILKILLLNTILHKKYNNMYLLINNPQKILDNGL